MLQRHIKSIHQFAQMKDDDRRSILRFLSDEQYADVLKVMGQMPLIKFNVKSEGKLNEFLVNEISKMFRMEIRKSGLDNCNRS